MRPAAGASTAAVPGFNVPAWESGLPVPSQQPKLKGDLTADVCVIGLGGAGLTVITQLCAAGLSVIGLDKGTVAGGAAGRNGGLLLAGLAAFHHDAVRLLGADTAVSWYRDTMDEVDRMLAETPGQVHRTGSLRIAADDAELADCEEQFAAMQAAGLPVERYSGPEGRGLLFPHDAVFNPLARNRLLASRAIAAGARLFEDSVVTEIAAGQVASATGRVSARAIVVTSDAGLPELLPELADDIRPLRLQMLATAPVAGLRLRRPVYYRWGFEYWQQLADGRLLLGGFRDRGGPGEWGADAVPGAEVQQLLSEFLEQHLGVKAPVTHRWAARVGYRDAVLPLHGEVRPSVWAAGGYNGSGNVIGSLLGRRIAAEVSAAL